ncbi:MAG TPA: glucose/galactose MFS transporter, partial [Flavisolibacter sp.]|nr:glucose/galactose MFS transporter [Flavisolibacter sp.]
PSAEYGSFPFFLLALFILASGLAFLETAANPYMTVLGNPQTAAFRLNMAQSFNGVGSFLGPVIGGALFFGVRSAAPADLSSVKFVYIVIAAVVMLVIILFIKTPMPEVKEELNVTDQLEQKNKKLIQHRHFVFAVIAQFFYVAAQVGIAALFINYCTEKGLGITNERASYFLSGSLLLFTLGRFAGTAIMKFFPANRLLAIYAVINIILCFCVIRLEGMVSIYTLMAIFFFESIMFPTIFALGVKDLGSYTKKGASFIIMSIVGGALVPYVMGTLAQSYSTPFSYIVPMICFIIVLLFAVYGHKTKLSHEKILSDIKS